MNATILLQYEQLYEKINPNGFTFISTPYLVCLMKVAGLSQAQLKTIWNITFPEPKTKMDKTTIYKVFKLIGQFQNGKNPSSDNNTELIVPKFRFLSPEEENLWRPTESEIYSFAEKFTKLSNNSELLSASVFRNAIQNEFNLQVDFLKKVWNLVDIDQDGSIDQMEYIAIMKIMKVSQTGKVLPDFLPLCLIQYIRLCDNIAPKKFTPGGLSRDSNATYTEPINFNIVANDSNKAYELFKSYDSMNRDMITLSNMQDVFQRSGLPKQLLKSAWEESYLGSVQMIPFPMFFNTLKVINNHIIKNVFGTPGVSSNNFDDVSNLSKSLDSFPLGTNQNAEDLTELKKEISTIIRNIKEKDDELIRVHAELKALKEDSDNIRKTLFEELSKKGLTAPPEQFVKFQEQLIQLKNDMMDYSKQPKDYLNHMSHLNEVIEQIQYKVQDLEKENKLLVSKIQEVQMSMNKLSKTSQKSPMTDPFMENSFELKTTDILDDPFAQAEIKKDFNLDDPFF